jgi:hypothetical protein
MAFHSRYETSPCFFDLLEAKFLSLLLLSSVDFV